MKKKILALISLSAVACLTLPTAAVADSGLGSKGFTVKAKYEPQEGKKFLGFASGPGYSNTGGDSDGQNPPGGNPPGGQQRGVMLLEIGEDACEFDGGAGQYFYGISADTNLTSPTGTKTPLVEGWNAMDIEGTWAIDGEFDVIGSQEIDEINSGSCIVGSSRWANTGTTQAAYAFYGNPIKYFEEIPDSMQNMRGMFGYLDLGSERFQVTDGWHTENVTDMSSLFDQSRVYSVDHQVVSDLNLEKLNISSVTDMSWMLRGVSYLATGIEDWDVSKVTNMEGMFAAANGGMWEYDLPQPDLSGWDVSNVKNMGHMFAPGKGENHYNRDLKGWDFSSVENIDRMFESTLYEHDASTWNVCNVTSHEGFFLGERRPNVDQDRMPKFGAISCELKN